MENVKKRSLKKIRVAINGVGRIGRAFLKVARRRKEIQLIAVNDLADIRNVAYLIKYDTVYGRAPFEVRIDDSRTLYIENVSIRYLSESDPAKLPWRELDIDVVVESTGVFDSYEKARAHLSAGAKRVVISAPVKDEPPDGIVGATVLAGINEEKLKTCDISSNASCTTNAGSPVLAILEQALGVDKALLTTVHAYTASQSIVDAPSKGDLRRGRAGAANLSPSSTGAAVATTKALSGLAGRFDGVAIRVPVPCGSLADLTVVVKRDTTRDEVNDILKKAAGEKRWENIFAVTEEPIVSSDIIGCPLASLADLSFTRVVGGNLVKVLVWYDNEVGYAHTLVRQVMETGKYAVGRR